MVDPGLTKYIESMKDSGFSGEETRKKLLNAGWDAKEVDKALGTGPAPAAVAPATKPTASVMAYQGIGIRFAAQLIDGVLLFFVYFIIALPLTFIFGVASYTGGYDSSGPLSLLLQLILAVIGFVYFVIMEGTAGKTVGKMVCGIRVVKEDGSPCDMHASFIRNILRIVDSLPFAYLVGVILISGSDKKQRLGDRTAKTVVVKA